MTENEYGAVGEPSCQKAGRVCPQVKGSKKKQGRDTDSCWEASHGCQGLRKLKEQVRFSTFTLSCWLRAACEKHDCSTHRAVDLRDVTWSV